MSFSQFGALGMYGLKSPETVRRKWKNWDFAVHVGKAVPTFPGGTFGIPDLEYGASLRRNPKSTRPDAEGRRRAGSRRSSRKSVGQAADAGRRQARRRRAARERLRRDPLERARGSSTGSLVS